MMGMQMTPDQAAKAFDLRQKFMNDTADLRKQMMVKQAELGELWRAKDPDKAKVAAKQKEVNARGINCRKKALLLSWICGRNSRPWPVVPVVPVVPYGRRQRPGSLSHGAPGS